MFFESIAEIPEIARQNSTTIFVLPEETKLEIKNSLILEPKEKTIISIEQVREIMNQLALREKNDKFIIIRPADKLGLDAANALLKNLEEPKEKVHFILVTNQLSELLPTILSRATIYVLRHTGIVDEDIIADQKTKDLAKKLIVARPADLPNLAEEICKKKDGVRDYALNILSISIEMLYKSYFKTKNPVFVKKIPAFLTAYDNINRNGHIKLHLVADLI